MKTKKPGIAAHAAYLVIALLFLFPFAWSAINSVKSSVEASASPPTFLPSRISTENFEKLATYGAGVGSYAANSLAVALIATMLSIALSSTAGYGFARYDFRLKGPMFLVIVATMVLPFQTIITPLFFLMNGLGLSNSLFGLALVYTLLQIAFGTLVMRNTFAAVPREIEEAARIDGCGSGRVMTQVMLPLAAPGVVTVGIISFINSWNEFLASLIFISEEKRYTLPVMLSNIRSGLHGAIDWGELQAGLVIAALPCLVIFFAFQRYYIAGLTSGSVKG
jgi:ABC-type sugar transport system, permease component